MKQQNSTILSISGGRPFRVVGTVKRKHRNPKWGGYWLTVIRYVDGLQPDEGTMKKSDVERAKRLRPTEERYWWKVDSLLQEGFDLATAKQAAARELTSQPGRPARIAGGQADTEVGLF